MKLNKSGSLTAMLDMFLIMVMGFFVLLIIAILLIKSEKRHEIQSNAEVIIYVEWDQEIIDDVDAYVRDPLNRVVAYTSRETELMNLDRDDLGRATDTIRLPNGKKIVIKENKEVVTIRGIVPGEYIVNTHMYSKNSDLPCNVTVTVEKLNPYSIIYQKELVLKEKGQEETAVRFTLNENGDLVSTSELPVQLIGASEQ